jgi:hypothetical protein
MAGATREITDPVEAAKHGIGSSKRLIAATLDDLSAHHSWLETYHRDERLRAERLRRRELRERLERGCERTAGRAKRAAKTSYMGGRRVARFSRRHALIFAHWASPRLRILARRAATRSSTVWAWTRTHLPIVADQALAAARDGFAWTVQASEEAGHIFRLRLSEATEAAAAELWLRTAPVRHRGTVAWLRLQRDAQRIRVREEKRLTEAIATSRMLAQTRKRLYRWTVRRLRIGLPLVRRAHATAHRVEDELSALVLRIGPAFRALLQSHMPEATTPAKQAAARPSRALILRPTTALTCIGLAEDKLPVPYSA